MQIALTRSLANYFFPIDTYAKSCYGRNREASRGRVIKITMQALDLIRRQLAEFEHETHRTLREQPQLFEPEPGVIWELMRKARTKATKFRLNHAWWKFYNDANEERGNF